MICTAARVAVEPADALAGDGAARRSARSHSSSAGQARGASRRPVSCSVWPTWSQVGQQPLAAGRAEHPGGQARAPRSPRTAAATPRPRSSSAQPRQPVGELVGERRRRRRRARSAVWPRNDVSAAARTRPDRCGCSSASSRASHSSPAGDVQQLGAAADHRRDAALGERRRDQLGLRPLADEHRDVARRAIGSPSQVASEASSAAMSAAQSAAMWRRASSAPDRPLGEPEAVARAPAAAGTAPATGAPASRRAGVGGRDVAHHDPRVAQRGAAQHDLQPLDQGGVAAPVGVEGGLRRGGAPRPPR